MLDQYYGETHFVDFKTHKIIRTEQYPILLENLLVGKTHFDDGYETKKMQTGFIGYEEERSMNVYALPFAPPSLEFHISNRGSLREASKPTEPLYLLILQKENDYYSFVVLNPTGVKDYFGREGKMISDESQKN